MPESKESKGDWMKKNSTGRRKKNSSARRPNPKKEHKFPRILVGGMLIALGCGCFLYPNFREWNTQREVESIIEKFDETYSKGVDKKEDAEDKNYEARAKTTAEENNQSPESSKNEDSAGDSAAAHDSADKEDKKTEIVIKKTITVESESNGASDNPEADLTNEEDNDDSEDEARPYQKLYDEMLKYNQNLANNGQNIVDAWSYEQQPFDLSQMDIDEDDPVIGYIEIPDMKIRLPLMLGASKRNLERGAAVLSETSMPIGGDNTNCVIAGHRGWEGSAYFQYIENMKKGSKVYITNPWETLVYECTSTQVIYPDNVKSILIQPGKDMVTLFSCHPYVLGGGPYRYLVFCERVDTQKRQEASGVLNPEAEEPAPAEEAEKVVVTDTVIIDNPAQTPDEEDIRVGQDEENNEDGINEHQTSKDQPEPSQSASPERDQTVSVTPNIQETSIPDDTTTEIAIQSQRGINLIALEQTLRYILPITVVAVSIIVILFRNSKPKKKKIKNPKREEKRRKKNEIK